MSTTVSYQIAPNLFINSQAVGKVTNVGKSAPSSINHILILDCSGSMSYDLPKIRTQLKTKLPQLLNVGDTVSIVWFSGKREFGPIVVGEHVENLQKLGKLNQLLDQWLKPVGMTGFREPLEFVKTIVTEVNNGNPFSLFFMSDGHDNQWSRTSILDAAKQLAGDVSSATFVEYGYYADRMLLSAMAESMGGMHIHADDFNAFEPMIWSSIMTPRRRVRTTEFKLNAVNNGGEWAIGGFVFQVTGGDLLTHSVSAQDGGVSISIPFDVANVYYLTHVAPQNAMTLAMQPPLQGVMSAMRNAMYAALSLYSVRMRSDVIFPLLNALGDVAYTEQFTNCFGKQKYTDFMNATKRAAFDVDAQLTKGYDPDLLPPDDAFTVLDLLQLLSQRDANVLLDHPTFKYSKISRSRVNADEFLSTEEQEKLLEIQLQMSTERNAKKLKEYQAQIDEILVQKRSALKFEADEAPEGYSISALTYNESRPNVSLLVKKTGHVNLRERYEAMPADEARAKIDVRAVSLDNFRTFIYRNYAIIQDGMVNVEQLPVIIDHSTYVVLKVMPGVDIEPLDGGPPDSYLINLKSLPIINRKMVQEVSAEEVIKLEYELTKQRAAFKVYKAMRTEMFPDAKADVWIKQYGSDATAWLHDQGLTEYSGFNPKMVQAPVTDAITTRELDIKLKGYSTLPPVGKVRDDMGQGKKLNGPATLMAKIITNADAWLKANPAKLHKAWLVGNEAMVQANVRGLTHKMAQIKFSIIVGQTWFHEFASLDEKTYAVAIDNEKIIGTCELREVEVKI